MANRDKIISKFNKRQKTKQRVTDDFSKSPKKKGKDTRALRRQHRQREDEQNFGGPDD